MNVTTELSVGDESASSADPGQSPSDLNPPAALLIIPNYHRYGRVRDKPPHFPPLRGFGPQVGHPNLTVWSITALQQDPSPREKKTSSLHPPLPPMAALNKIQSRPIFTCSIQLALCVSRTVLTLAFPEVTGGSFLMQEGRFKAPSWELWSTAET